MVSKLKASKKQTYLQILVLFALCLVIALVSWIMGKGTFTLHLPPEYSDEHMSVEWKEGEISIQDIIYSADQTDIILKPTTSGTYTMQLRKDQDTILYHDTIRVLGHGSAYSMGTGHFTGDTGMIGAIALFFAGTALLCLIRFSRLKGPAAYSYESVACLSGGIFCGVTGVLMIWLFVSWIINPDLTHISNSLIAVTGAAETFIFWTSPLLFIFSVMMIVSNIALLRHEHYRSRHMMGLGISIFLIISVFFLWSYLTRTFRGTAQDYHIFSTINIAVAVLFALFECALACTAVCMLRASSHIPEPDQDYIIILGSSSRKSGTLPPMLESRVTLAMDFWENQKETTGKEAVLVPSGGKTGMESMAEAEAISQYMLTRGIPKEAVMKEDRSQTTDEKMAFSYEKILEREREKGAGKEKVNTIFVTSNYNVFHSGIQANNAGLAAEGLGSLTKWWFWPNAYIRECLGMLLSHIWAVIILLLIVIAIFSGFSVLSFNIRSMALTLGTLM